MLLEAVQELELLEYRQARRFQEAYNILESLLRNCVGEELGRALLQYGLTLCAQSKEFTPDALRHFDRALPLLETRPFDYMRAIVQSLVCASFMDDRDRFKGYMRMGLAMLGSGRPESAAWAGRIYNWRAYGYQYDANGAKAAGRHEDVGRLFDQARMQLELALQFYQGNAGPFSEHDRQCQIGIAEAALADVLWDSGKQPQAVVIMRKLFNKEDKFGTGSREYLAGRIAAAEGLYQDAIAQLSAAIRKAKAMQDSALEFKATEALGEVYLELGEGTKLQSLVEPLMVEAAKASAGVTLYRLQELMVRSKSVGR